MRILPIACLSDNYAYLVICEASNAAAIVDPSEASPVIDAVKAEGVDLVAIWNTHHHWDHVGGNEELLQQHPDLEVVGHASDEGRIKGQTVFANDGDEISLGETIRARIIYNPGHTSGAISYYIAEASAVFTGDTLFAGGCGRLFEGSPEEMHQSLSTLAALPEDTRVYFGHEYTAANLRFAAAVEPESAAIGDRQRAVGALRDAGKPSVPSTIADERATNPFLRAAIPEVVSAAKKSAADPAADVFAALRQWKDNF